MGICLRLAFNEYILVLWSSLGIVYSSSLFFIGRSLAVIMIRPLVAVGALVLLAVIAEAATTYKDDYKKDDHYKEDSYKDDHYKMDSYKDDHYKQDSYKKDDHYKEDSYKDDHYKHDSYKKDDYYKEDSYKDDHYKDDYKEDSYK